MLPDGGPAAHPPRRHRVHPGRSGVPRRRRPDLRRRPGRQLAPRHRDGAHADPGGGRCRGRAHGRLAAQRLAADQRHRRPRRRAAGDAPRLRFQERGPGPRRFAAGPLRRRRAQVTAHRAGRAGRRDGGAVRPRLHRRSARRPAHPRARAADARGHDTRAQRHRRRRPAGPRGGHRREDRDQRGDGRVQAGVPAVGDHDRRGDLQRRVQHPRGAGHHHAGRPGDRVQRPGHQGDRDERRRQRARSGQPGQPDHRPGGAARRAQRRRRRPRRCRPRRARQPGEDLVLLPRARGLVAVHLVGHQPRRARGDQRDHRVPRGRPEGDRRPEGPRPVRDLQDVRRLPAHQRAPQGRCWAWTRC